MARRAGINVASFASNHCMDYGADALIDTVKHFEDAGVRMIGAGKNIAEARKPLIVEKNGTKIGWHLDRVRAWERGERIAPITIDMALTRNIVMGTRNVELRLETFNLLNHFNWGNPAVNLNNRGTFGRITTMQGAPRIMQFGVKFGF